MRGKVDAKQPKASNTAHPKAAVGSKPMDVYEDRVDPVRRVAPAGPKAQSKGPPAAAVGSKPMDVYEDKLTTQARRAKGQNTGWEGGVGRKAGPRDVGRIKYETDVQYTEDNSTGFLDDRVSHEVRKRKAKAGGLQSWV